MSDTHATHSNAPILLEVERFEHVETEGAERVLLRLDGRYTEREGKRVLDAMLFVDDGLAVHRHAPLPDLGDDPSDAVDGWLWRAAFDVPSSYLTDARTRFALEAHPGSLLDLPRPGLLATATNKAIPITSRAAKVARRYAAAVAIVLAVAVAPGGLPAQARTEVLRVRHADGSVVYMTTDGRQLTALPPDAVIIDQSAPAPAPAPEPAPQPEPAPEPQAAPAMQAAPTSDDDAAKNAESLRGAADEAHRQSGATNARASRRRVPRHTHSHKSDNGAEGSRPAAPAATHASAGNDATKDHGTDRVRHPGRPANAEAATPPAEAAPLQSLPALVATSPEAALEPLVQVDAAVPAAAPDAGPALPGKSFHSMDDLDGAAAAGTGPAHDAGTTGAPQVTGGTAPNFADVPALEPTTPPAEPRSDQGHEQRHSGSRHHAEPPKLPTHDAHPAHPNGTGGNKPPRPPAPSTGSVGGSLLGNGNGGPNGFDGLPGPVEGVPNFVIQKFHVPPFLLPIYQAAGIQYGVRWEVLAAINEIETDYGRNLNVSSAGALGWMQFMPATWRQYGVDANKDGKRDPYNPVDAIFASARYLKAAGAGDDIRKAIFAYNHAGWYVDSVMLRARLIAGYPTDLIGSLTGLTEGRFPVAARARYADETTGKSALKRVPRGHNAANVVASDATRRGIDIYARKGAPVVAVNDGVIKEIGRSPSKGNYVVLQDVYGNRYTYSHLGSRARFHAVPKSHAGRHGDAHAEAVSAKDDPKPSAPASAGTQRPGAAPKQTHAARQAASKRHSKRAATAKRTVAAVKQRLFAHPNRPTARRNGGVEQMLNHKDGASFATYDNYFSRALGLNSRNATLKPLRKGSHVVGSTVLGRVGATGKGDAPRFHFEIQPAGRGAPRIDPKPILDGWKLLESSAVYRSSGRNVLYGDGDFSIGEIMLLPKPLLAKRVLSDPRIDIYPGGRNDIQSNQVDRRVLVVLAYLAESGLEPTVSSLRGNHGLMTSSGNVSEHSSGNAVDISAINGVPIYGHQGRGGVTEQAVRRLMQLQGTLRPHQIISLLDFGQNTLALSDHDDHIHVGFHPLFGTNSKLGRQTASVLKPGQWDSLVERLGEIQNPVVPTHPSKYAIPDRNGHGE